MASLIEIQAMRRAIALSARGLGTTSPNPPVGCVLLDADGRLVGEGFHRRKGEAHAEGNALAAAGPDARGGTAVVTLEPCNHVGRAPACRQLLVDAGIVRVVVAVTDPTSRGEGGISALRKAGITVETGVLHEEAMLVLDPWRTSLDLSRPVLTWTYLMDSTGIRSALNNVPAAERHRRNADAVLTEEGHLTEAVPDSHGPGLLDVPPALPRVDPTDALQRLYRGGIRHLVLDGTAGLDTPFVAHGLVPHLVAYLGGDAPSARPTADHWHVVPSEYSMTAVERIDHVVAITANRPQVVST